MYAGRIGDALAHPVEDLVVGAQQEHLVGQLPERGEATVEVADVAGEIDDEDAVGDRFQRRRQLRGADRDRLLDPLLLAAVDQGDDVERVAGRRLDPADAAHHRHGLAAGAVTYESERMWPQAPFSPTRCQNDSSSGVGAVASMSRPTSSAGASTEQAAGGAVGGDDAQALGLDQADRLEHRLDQRRPGATRRLGDAERVDRQRVVHRALTLAAWRRGAAPEGAEHGLGRPGAVLIPRRRSRRRLEEVGDARARRQVVERRRRQLLGAHAAPDADAAGGFSRSRTSASSRGVAASWTITLGFSGRAELTATTSA